MSEEEKAIGRVALPGTVLQYRLTAQDAATTKGWESKASASIGKIDEPEGAEFPLLVISSIPSEEGAPAIVSGKVQIYGNDDLEVLAQEGTGLGEWSWPPTPRTGR